jgi:hypothetical protein
LTTQVIQAALQAISDEDLRHPSDFCERGVPIAQRTPAEHVAMEHYSAECEAAVRMARAARVGPARRRRTAGLF